MERTDPAPMAEAPKPVYFATPAAWRAWLQEHHARETELLVGFHKVGSGLPSMSWPESVDEALCFGWIDGVRRSLDATRYTIRFSLRRPTSIWSRNNLAKAEALIASGRMQPAGLAAYERRRPDRSDVYSFERDNARLGRDAELQFKAQPRAWAFFSRQAPSYRKAASWWAISAKRPETRARRLERLIAFSFRGGRLF